MKSGFPWHLLLYSLLGAIVLRIGFDDDLEYLGACLLYALLLGVIAAMLEIRDEDRE